MQELLKNLLYLGAGAAFVTKEKIEELKNDLVDKGKLTQDEGKQFVDDLLKKSDDFKGKFEEKINDAVTEQLDKMNVAKSDDIDDLRAQIQELRALVEKKQKS
jgi:polyhydroxyalkanoate synthesis regulator phasin